MAQKPACSSLHKAPSCNIWHPVNRRAQRFSRPQTSIRATCRPRRVRLMSVPASAAVTISQNWARTKRTPRLSDLRWNGLPAVVPSAGHTPRVSAIAVAISRAAIRRASARRYGAPRRDALAVLAASASATDRRAGSEWCGAGSRSPRRLRRAPGRRRRAARGMSPGSPDSAAAGASRPR